MSTQGIVKEIVFSRHPLFKELQATLHIDARLSFETLAQLEGLLPHFGYSMMPDSELQPPVRGEYVFWTRSTERQREYIGLTRGLFDETGHLRLMGMDDWRDGYVVLTPRMAESFLSANQTSLKSTASS
jgi:hypothetical protein